MRKEYGDYAMTFLRGAKSTGSGLLAIFGRDFDQALRQMICMRVKTLRNTNLVASRLVCYTAVFVTQCSSEERCVTTQKTAV